MKFFITYLGNLFSDVFTGTDHNSLHVDVMAATGAFADSSFQSMPCNPANGLPMCGDESGFDISGNAFGSDFSCFD